MPFGPNLQSQIKTSNMVFLVPNKLGGQKLLSEDKSTFFFNALLPVRLAAQESAPCKENHEGEKEWDPKPETQEALKDGDGDIC